MVRIRLQRHGAKKRPFYRVVAADKRSKRDGRFIELLGTYDPLHEPPLVRLNKERVDHWLSVGASPSETVRGLIAQLADGKAIDLSAEGAEAAARKAKAESRAQELVERREAAKKAHMEAAKAEEAAAAEAKQAEAAAAQEAAAAKEAAAQEAADAKEAAAAEEAAADAAPAEGAADAPAEETAEETASEDAE